MPPFFVVVEVVHIGCVMMIDETPFSPQFSPMFPQFSPFFYLSQGKPAPKSAAESADFTDLFCRFVGFLNSADLFCRFVGFL